MTGQMAVDGTLELAPPFDPAVVTDLLRAFSKAVRAHQLYLGNNPMHARAMDVAKTAFSAVWKETDSLALQVTDCELQWLGRVVLEEQERTSDSIPWALYKDGIRELVFHRGFEEGELMVLLGLMQRARLAAAHEDDLLTLLWEHDFSRLQYRYVDVLSEGGTPVEGVRAEQQDRVDAPLEVERDAQVLVSSSVARMDDYDSTLYFLDDSEIEYLQTEIKREFASELRVPVVASLLDTYEQQTDPTVREEIAAGLDSLFLLFLSVSQFGAAAYLIRESALAASRAVQITPAESQRLLQLVDRLSEREVLEQLLAALEETRLRPPQTDLHELLGQLRPAALETLLAWVARSRNPELRVLLETAGSRLAAAHSSELVRLIDSDNPAVVYEAMRRAGAMRSTAAVGAIAAAMTNPVVEMRLAGLNALAEIASPGALQVIERSLVDPDPDVRTVAVRVLGARGHRAALGAIEKHLRARELRDAALAEKMAFFEGYGALSGEAGVHFLSEILNSRKLIGRREDGEMRACAAMALGRIGSPQAMRALEKALSDKDPVVRNAVSRAVRA